MIIANNILDVVQKNLRLTFKTLIHENLQFFFCDKDVSINFYPMLMLLPFQQGRWLEKSGHKWQLNLPYDFGN